MGLAGFFALLMFAFVLAACWPVAVIWALNTLFGLSIAFTFKTWLAALVLIGAVAVQRSQKK